MTAPIIRPIQSTIKSSTNSDPGYGLPHQKPAAAWQRFLPYILSKGRPAGSGTRDTRVPWRALMRTWFCRFRAARPEAAFWPVPDRGKDVWPHGDGVETLIISLAV
jgi:hypothetical protein